MIKPLLTQYTKDDIKEFAEGNKILEDVLIFCFESKIPTHACCAGHLMPDGKKKRPYLSFLITAETQKFVNYCLEHKFANEDFVCTSLMYVDYPNLQKSTFQLSLKKDVTGDFNQNCQKFFNEIKNAVQEFEQKNYQSPKFDFLNRIKQKFCRFEINFHKNNITDMFIQSPNVIEIKGYNATQKGILVYYEKTSGAKLKDMEKDLLEKQKNPKLGLF